MYDFKWLEGYLVFHKIARGEFISLPGLWHKGHKDLFDVEFL